MTHKNHLARITRKNPLLKNTGIHQSSYFVESLSHHLGSLNQLYICPVEKTVFFNKVSLDLSHQPKLFLIFYILHKSKEDGLNRGEIIEKIYGPLAENLSERQARCYRHNIIKLLSRARTIAHECFGSENFRVEWFPYSKKMKTWYLCRPDMEHFQHNLGSDCHF